MLLSPYHYIHGTGEVCLQERIVVGKSLTYYFLFCFVLFSIFLSTAAYSFAIVCPQKLNIEQKLLSQPANWQMQQATPTYYVNGLTFYSGNPKDQASLKPESSDQKQAVWTFSAADQIYIACEYHQTTIQFTQALPPKTTTCQVNYDQSARSDEGRLLPTQINCH
jgi:hypothetical protein